MTTQIKSQIKHSRKLRTRSIKLEKEHPKLVPTRSKRNDQRYTTPSLENSYLNQMKA